MSTETKAIRPFGFRDKFGYFMGDFGCTISFTLISSFMMIFYTQYIGVSLLDYSLIILLTKIWDGVNDPIIGALADRLQPKGGEKFRPWLFWGSFPLAFSICLLFADTSALPYWIKIAVCIGGYLIWDIAYTVVNVPYGSMNATITADPVERSQLSAWRSMGAFFVGLLVMMVMPLFLYKKATLADGKTVSLFAGDRMFTIAIILGLVTLLAIQILYRFSTERIKHKEHDGQKFNYFKMLAGFVTNRTMLAVSLTAIIQVTNMAAGMIMGTLVFQMYYNNGALASFSVIGSAAVFLLAPFVKGSVKRWGKKNLCSWPILISAGIYIVMFLIPNLPIAVWIIGHAVASLGMGFYSLISWSMVSDSIDSIELKTGRRDEGSIYATYSMVRKIAQGIGQALIPFLIAVVIPGLNMNDELTWSALYGTQIKNLALILPAIGCILMFVMMRFIYDIDKNRERELPVLLGRIPKDVSAGIEEVAAGMSRREEG